MANLLIKYEARLVILFRFLIYVYVLRAKHTCLDLRHLENWDIWGCRNHGKDGVTGTGLERKHTLRRVGHVLSVAATPLRGYPVLNGPVWLCSRKTHNSVLCDFHLNLK